MPGIEKHSFDIEEVCTVTAEVNTDKGVWDEGRVDVYFTGFRTEPLILTDKELSQVNAFVQRHSEVK